MEIARKCYRVKRTKLRKDNDGDFVAKINPKCIPFYLRSNYLIVSKHFNNGHEKIIFKIPVLIQTDDSLSKEEIMLDMKVRIAIGANEGDNVQIDSYNFIKSLKKYKLWTYFFGRQVNLLRTKYSSFTDMEIPLCRISKHVMKTIGIEEGDKIFVESSTKRISIKAFELPDSLVAKRKGKEKNESSIYGEKNQPKDKRRRDLLSNGRESDLPWILLDFDARNELEIDTNDPVRVYRNVQHAVFKKIHLISIPLILTIIGFVLSLDLFKDNDPLKIFVYTFGLFFVVFLNLLSIRLIVK